MLRPKYDVGPPLRPAGMSRCQLCGVSFQPNANPRRLDAYYCDECLPHARKWRAAMKADPALRREFGGDRFDWCIDPAVAPPGVLRAEDV